MEKNLSNSLSSYQKIVSKVFHIISKRFFLFHLHICYYYFQQQNRISIGVWHFRQIVLKKAKNCFDYFQNFVPNNNSVARLATHQFILASEGALLTKRTCNHNFKAPTTIYIDFIQ